MDAVRPTTRRVRLRFGTRWKSEGVDKLAASSTGVRMSCRKPGGHGLSQARPNRVTVGAFREPEAVSNAPECRPKETTLFHRNRAGEIRRPEARAAFIVTSMASQIEMDRPPPKVRVCSTTKHQSFPAIRLLMNSKLEQVLRDVYHFQWYIPCPPWFFLLVDGSI